MISCSVVLCELLLVNYVVWKYKWEKLKSGFLLVVMGNGWISWEEIIIRVYFFIIELLLIVWFVVIIILVFLLFYRVMRKNRKGCVNSFMLFSFYFNGFCL